MWVIISGEKVALGRRIEIQDGGSQHVVDVGTGIRVPDSSLLDPSWRIVAAILTSVSCLFLGFPWGMSPGITSWVGSCREGKVVQLRVQKLSFDVPI